MVRSFQCFLPGSWFCATGIARYFPSSGVDINYCPVDSFRQDAVIKSRCNILSCSIIQILIYFFFYFKPQDLVVEASHYHFLFFFSLKESKSQIPQCFGYLQPLNNDDRIVQWMLCFSLSRKEVCVGGGWVGIII